MASRAGWLTFLFLTVLPNQSQACNIPVFRYALEHWQPASYEVVVFHRGPLPQSARDLLARFDEPGRAVNAIVTLVDLAGKVEKVHQQLWEQHKTQKLPWLVVRFPDSGDKTPPLWAGPVEDESVSALVDSPIRQSVVQHLLQGDSAVFVLLTGGNKEADAAAEALLRRELARLQEAVKLPETSKDDPDLSFHVPLKVSLSLIVLSRESVAERFLIQTLLRAEDDLTRVPGPIAFAIFGRGRVLPSIQFDETLTAEQLDEVAGVLCGTCSSIALCQACSVPRQMENQVRGYLCAACTCLFKERNPGVDLLLACSWGDRLAAVPPMTLAVGEVEKIPVPSRDEDQSPSSPETPAAQLPTDPPVGPKSESGCCFANVGHRFWLRCGIAVAAAMVLASGFWTFRKSRCYP